MGSGSEHRFLAALIVVTFASRRILRWMRVRAVNCSGCGAPKVTPSRSAYLYCDYCGQYVDWDFYRAVSSKEDRLPGPQYERLAAELTPRSVAAKAAGDEVAYEQVQRELFEAHIRSCPASYSPRIGEASYRASMLDYMAKYYTLIAFDPELARLSAAMDEATRALEWEPRESDPQHWPTELEDYRDVIALTAAQVRCASVPFWRLFDAFEAFTRAAQDAAERAGLFEQYPDRVDASRVGKTAYSVFCEAWLPYLEPTDQAEILRRTGLRGSYREIDPSTVVVRHCGRCGEDVQVPTEGSKASLCESCGHVLDTGRGEVGCGGCGAKVVVPRAFDHVACPYCRAEIRCL